MNNTFVLDACTLIAFLNDEVGSYLVEELLQKAKYGKIELVINKINLLEIYYDIYRDCDHETASSVMQAIKQMPIQIISSLSDEVFFEAGHLKAGYKISLADSIALAESITREAALVTADHHELDKLEQLEIFKAFWIR